MVRRDGRTLVELLVDIVIFGILAALLLPVSARPSHAAETSGKAAGVALAPPVVSQPGGMFNATVSVGLSTTEPGAVIRYTLDGSVPTGSSPHYTVPISMNSLVGTPNVISELYGTSPAGEIFKANILRARVFKAGAISSNTISHTYFIDPSMTTRYGLAVFSLITETDNLFDDDTGIYVNYDERGIEWERDVHVEFFDGHLTGSPSSVPPAFAQDMGVRMHGGYSRSLPRKTLRLYARSEYGASRVEYPVLGPDVPEGPDSFKRLLLRNGGNESSRTLIRDAFAHELVRNTDMAAQPHRPVIVFINGEYWGVHMLMERIDKHYLGDYYGVDPDDLDVIGIYYSLFVEEGDTAGHFAMRNFLGENDLTDPDIYEAVEALINVPNHITHHTTEIFIQNGDWPQNNRKWWRPRDGSRPWEWLYFDTDEATGVTWGASYDRIDEVAQDDEFDYVFTRLLTSPQYRQDFITRYADLLNTRFTSSYMLARISALRGALEPEMPEHIHRWIEPTFSNWENLVDDLEDWSADRPAYAWQHLGDYFGLVGRSLLTVNANNPAMGAIAVNTLPKEEISLPWTGSYFHDVPVTLTAIPEPGFRFAGWSQTGQASLEIVLYVTSDRTRTALFEPEPAAPLLRINGVLQGAGSYVVPGDVLSMTLPGGASGTVYYTIDGADPWGGDAAGGISPSALMYTAPISLTESVAVNARILEGGGWSAMVSGTFVMGAPIDTLRITEFMYHPADGGAEFIEIHNTGTEPVSLLGVHFADAVTFAFLPDVVLAPGAFTVLVRDDDLARFAVAYPSVPIGGLYKMKLDNGGELVVLRDGVGTPLFSYTYDDEAPWDIEADGLGYSLILIDLEGDPNDPLNWRASIPRGGTPGKPGGLDGEREEEDEGGDGGGPVGEPTCLLISPTTAGPNDEVTVDAYDSSGRWVDLRTFGLVEFCFGIAGCVWTDGSGGEFLDVSSGSGVFTITQAILDSTIFDFWIEPDEVWFTLANPGNDSSFDTVAQAVAAGGSCAGGSLITNLVMYDTDSAPWTIETSIQEGDALYTDRGYTLSTLPPAYAGLDWIKTSNDSADWRDGHPDVIASFDVTADATVFVAVDPRVSPPPCLRDWTVEAGDFIMNSNDGDLEYVVLSREFTAGSTVEMCRYEEDAGFYTILVKRNGPGVASGVDLTLIVDGATFAEEGGVLTLHANDEMLAPYQWRKYGVNIGGETTDTLAFATTTTGDSGMYTLIFNDGAKVSTASDPVFVQIFPLGALPVTGFFALALLAVVLVGLGTREKK